MPKRITFGKVDSFCPNLMCIVYTMCTTHSMYRILYEPHLCAVRSNSKILSSLCCFQNNRLRTIVLLSIERVEEVLLEKHVKARGSVKFTAFLGLFRLQIPLESEVNKSQATDLLWKKDFCNGLKSLKSQKIVNYKIRALSKKSGLFLLSS